MSKLKVREQVAVFVGKLLGSSEGFALNDAVESTHYVDWPQGTTGTVFVDVGRTVNGPWVEKGTLEAPAAAADGPAMSYYQLNEPVEFARHRISGTLAGGSINSYYDAWQ